MADAPRHAAGLDVHEVEDGLVIYDVATDRVHYLNATATLVFELCTGEHEDSEIVQLVGDAFNMPEPARDEVVQCLAQLHTEGVIR